MNHIEYHLQVATSDWLNGIVRVGNKTYASNPGIPGLLFTHCYQGRSEEEGFFLKSMGVKPGMNDCLNWWRNPNAELLKELSAKHKVYIPLYQCGFLELKTEDGVLSPAQKKIQSICHLLGIEWALARNTKEVVETYTRWGCDIAHTAIRQLDTRTKEQKFKDAMEFFKP